MFIRNSKVAKPCQAPTHCLDQHVDLGKNSIGVCHTLSWQARIIYYLGQKLPTKGRFFCSSFFILELFSKMISAKTFHTNQLVKCQKDGKKLYRFRIVRRLHKGC